MDGFKIDNTYGVAELQYEFLDIMKYIHKICKDHNIVYSLTGGSLLGAVRHNGFIPWDDDFDIMFDRKNYEKFVRYMCNHPSDSYILELDQWVYRVRKKNRIRGIRPSIDLFILDQTPKNKIVYKVQVLLLRILQGMLRNNVGRIDQSAFYQVCIRVTEKIGALFSNSTLFFWYDKISQWGNRGDSARLSIFNDRFQLLPLTYSRDLIDTVELHDFVDTQLFVISDYKQYLTRQYGDYMTLPPEKDRVQRHIL